ncbi:hypothetical protein ACFHW2_12200 [Actinomadura sp. LOL_016]|uniref:hypothetical protein n=1 Tax=unclassified Actinomadura TaxID=2626254 RepID=UPI003A7FA97F
MAQQIIPATGFPDVRTRLVDELNRELSRRYGPITETFAIHVRAGAQAIADPRILDPYEQSLILVAEERKRLANAALYWVSPHMTALTQAAAPGMPPFRPTPADMPAPYGFMYFASPFATADEVPVADTAVFADGSVHTLEGGTYQVCAVSWGPWDYQGAWPRGGTWFTFYTALDISDDDPDAAVLRRLPPLRLDNECVIAAHCTGVEEWPDRVQRTGGTAPWTHLALTAIRLMATSRTTTATEHTPIRAVRRRAARADVAHPDQPVNLLDVTARPRTERTPSDEHPGRNYRVRWVVEGHWRNQWYPASETHRPRYIDAYVKGPEGAPLQVKETVHLWRDMQEAAR